MGLARIGDGGYDGAEAGYSLEKFNLYETRAVRLALPLEQKTSSCFSYDLRSHGSLAIIEQSCVDHNITMQSAQVSQSPFAV